MLNLLSRGHNNVNNATDVFLAIVNGDIDSFLV